MLLKPRFGIRMWSGIWPPSKPKTETPERLFWPFWPRPPVLPSPEPMPRPTRTRPLRAPLLSRMSFSFISCTRFRFCRAVLPLPYGRGKSRRMAAKGEGGGRCVGLAGEALAARHQVGDLLAAALRDALGGGLLAERLEGRADHVVGIGRADRLGDDVVDAETLEHGAHRAAGDDAGARRGRAEIDAARAEMAEPVMMQRAAVAQRHADHRLPRRRCRLRD